MKRAVRTLLRLIASSLIVIGGLLLGLEYARRRLQEGGDGWARTLLGGGLIAAGMGLLALSGRLAQKITEDIDEE